MTVAMDWTIEIADYKLAVLGSCEIHKSVDLLADTCTIVLPAYSSNTTLSVEEKLKRGDKVTVALGYDGNLVTEFEGYLLSINTDDGSLTLNCEDDLFLFRNAVKYKQFVNTSVKDIASYLIAELGLAIELSCSLGITYEKFVISKANAYDVLKKIQDETKANIYLSAGVLHIHPPYIEKGGDVEYSFQVNIEKSSLKYIRKENKKIEIVVTNTSADGKKNEARFGTTGGEQVTISGNGLTKESMAALAEQEFGKRFFDGYDGDITTWLVPYVLPSYTATITDEDYEYKNGKYYVVSVTTTFNESGASRKVQIGIKLG